MEGEEAIPARITHADGWTNRLDRLKMVGDAATDVESAVHADQSKAGRIEVRDRGS
jgi:hypothetical protein